VVVRRSVFLLLAILPVATAQSQSASERRVAACGCERSASSASRKPRFLLPLAGGLGFLPAAIGSRGGPAALGLPALADIRDVGEVGPPNALAGERELAVGALAPDTATALPTLMVVAALLVAFGASLMRQRGHPRQRRPWPFLRSRTAQSRGGWRLRTVHRRRLGGALASLGGLLLVLGSREYAEGAQTQRRARAEWLRMNSATEGTPRGVTVPDVFPVGAATAGDPGLVGVGLSGGARSRVPNARMVSAVPLPAVAMSGREIRRGAVVARLVIPAIALDEIVMEGVGPVELNGGPGHFPGSALPGEAGNAIVSAHRDRHFRRLGELHVGSRIRTETRDRAVEWVITERRIVSRDTPALFSEPEATLTLTTCWPIRYFGSAPDRLLLVAKPAS